MPVDAADYSFDGCRDKLYKATQIVLAAETKYENAIKSAAESEAYYRRRLGDRFEQHRAAGKGVEESTTISRGECVVESKQRDTDAGMVKLRAEQLENARDSRRSLWRLVEWARQRDGAQNGGQPS